MSDSQSPNLYESPTLQAVMGPALRPGGLELSRRALSFCDLPDDSPVVDIGCGTGVTVGFLIRDCRLKACGLERSPAMLGQARNREPDLPLIQGTANRLPFRDNCLSAVLCECVLSLVEDTAGAWYELHRVLRAGGYLVVADVYARAPEHAHLLKSVPVNCCLKGARSREDLADRLHQNGFSLLVWEDHSQDLKRLAAQLAFAGWSLQTFWQNSGACVAVQNPQTIIRRARPGYFLMVALKRGRQ
jgi:SAM-dependent methyltransferase